MRKRNSNIIDEHIIISNHHDNFIKANTALQPLLASNTLDDSHDLTTTLRALGFIAGYRDNGDISALWYKGNNDEIRNETLRALAPFIDDGGFIIWRASGNRKWRNEFHDGIMTTLEARTVWVKSSDEHHTTTTDTPTE